MSFDSHSPFSRMQLPIRWSSGRCPNPDTSSRIMNTSRMSSTYSFMSCKSLDHVAELLTTHYRSCVSLSKNLSCAYVQLANLSWLSLCLVRRVSTSLLTIYPSCPSRAAPQQWRQSRVRRASWARAACHRQSRRTLCWLRRCRTCEACCRSGRTGHPCRCPRPWGWACAWPLY